MKKSLFLFILISFSLFSCEKRRNSEKKVEPEPSVAEKPVETINVGAATDFEPSGLSRSLAEGFELNIERFDSERKIFERLLSGDLDLGYIPLEAIEKLSQTEGFEKAVVSLGIFEPKKIFLVSKIDRNAFSFEDIRTTGEKIACFNFELASERKPLEPIFDLLDFSRSNSEIVPALVSGKVNYAVLPLEYANIAEKKSERVKIARELSEFDIPPTVLCANGRFFNTHFDYIEHLKKGQ